MPCDTVSTFGIDLGKLDPGTLMRGLTKDGHKAVVQTGDVITWIQDGQSMLYNTKTGKLEVRASAWRQQAPDAITAAVKQSFSRQIVRDQARKRGWTVKENGNSFKVIRNTV